MDRVFSVDDDRFWSHPPPVHQSTQNSSNLMNRSSSEWAFQRFLQEASASEPSPTSSSSKDVVQIKDQAPPPPARTTTTATAGHPNVPIDSEEYQAFLKSRLSLACAAVASRASCVKPLETAPPLAESGSQTNNASQTGSQVSAKGSSGGFDDNPKGPSNKDGSGVTPIGVPSLPSLQKKSPVQVKSTTSGSSRDQSDDDDLDLDTETTQNNDPLDVKRVRSVVRMLSNRESARRSRRRKQAHLTELETQVSQLRVENSTLLKRLSDVTQKYSEAAVDNRVLKADVETLRAKVKMAEETVKRVTGLNPLFQAMSEMSTAGIPSFDCSPSDTSTDAAPPVHDDHQQQHQQQQQHFYHHHNPASASSNNSSNPMSNHDQMVQNSMVDMHVPDNAAEVGGNKMGRTSSMQRVASLEHLQKRIRGGVGGGSCGSGGNQQQS